MIRWLLKRPSAKDHLVVSWSGQTLAYVLARNLGSHGFEVLKFGVERQPEGADRGGLDNLVRRLKALALDGFQVSIMLRPDQYQLLRIRTPAVAPDELRAAARYQIIKLLDTQLNDVTIDVMRVGDGRSRGAGHLAGHLFVVAATLALLRDVLDLCDAMRWSVSVIDIQEMAQRNLQTALAPHHARPGRANAALVLLDSTQAVLTIAADGELFYTRRFDLPRGFLDGAWDDGRPAATEGPAMPWPTDTAPGLSGDLDQEARANRFLMEVQRSLDHWDRLWSNLPLDGILLYAGSRTADLSGWLTQQLGQTVRPMEFAAQFPGFGGQPINEEAACLPLLGLLLRTKKRSLSFA